MTKTNLAIEIVSSDVETDGHAGHCPINLVDAINSRYKVLLVFQ